MADLPKELQERIALLGNDGDAFETAGDLASALARYGAAFNLLPEPKTDWDASAPILSKMGTAFFLDGRFEAGADALKLALQCAAGGVSPSIHLRLGQCELELDNRSAAIEHLTMVYQHGGADMFETEDPKYLAFLKKVRPALVR